MRNSSRCLRGLLFAGAIATLVLILLGASSAQLNLVYINSNTGLCPGCAANHNSVLAFINDGTGRLKPVTGMPFKTRGTGIYDAAPGTDFDEDQQLIINPEGTLLFAANMHDNTIAVFNINSDGTLTTVSGSPVASNGPQPASLGLLDNALSDGSSILVVANKDSDPGQTQTNPNYSTFFVDTAGQMTLNVNATVVLPTGSSPSQVLVNQKGALVFGMQFLGTNSQALLGSYRIKSDGSLTLINSVTPPTGGALFLGEAQHPVNSALYVGLPDVAQVAVYEFGVATGLISFSRTVTNPGGLVCWLTVNSAGTRLYTSETGSSTVSVYDLTAVLTPVLLQHFTLATGGSFGATNLALDPTGAFLYVLTGSTLHVLTVSSVDGTLTETVKPRPLPVRTGTIPAGLATVMK